MKKMLLTFLIILVSCTSIVETQLDTNNINQNENNLLNWKQIQLKDVATSKTFTVDQFKDKPILLESFAVWCPTCLEQQREIKRLMERGGDVIHISLDTDPNEDNQRVLEHLQIHEFKWLFAVSPVELTRALINEFGVGVVNAPQAPVVLICPNQSARLLQRGVKSPEKLKEAIAGC